MFKIGIIEQIDQDGIDLLKKHPNFNYEIIKDISKENLIKVLPKFDGVTLRVVKLNEDLLKNCKNLKVISRHGVGVDNVDLKYLKNNNINLLITATANAVSVAEHVMYMMLTLSKGITSYDRIVRSGEFKTKVNEIVTYELFNKKIIIAGFGRIGKNLIKRCLGFEMKIHVYDPYVSSEIIESFGGKKINDLSSSLKQTDFLSIHMPLNKDTKNLINLKTLKTMKKEAIIVNTARGGIINEHDLNEALNKKYIFAAGLDVFEKEPPVENHPIFKLSNVVLSPHNAALTLECRKRMATEAAENIVYFLNDKKKLNLNNIVNKSEIGI